MSWWIPLQLVAEETSQFWWSSSSIIVASGSAHVAAQDLVVLLVALGIVAPQSLQDAGLLVQMWCAGSSLVVAPGQHTGCGQGSPTIALY